MQGIFVGGHYLFFERESEKDSKLRETDNVQGQMHEHIFAPNKGYCVYYSSNKFATRSINFYEHHNVWIISSFDWGIFDHVMRLDQSHARKKKQLIDYNRSFFFFSTIVVL